MNIVELESKTKEELVELAKEMGVSNRATSSAAAFWRL
jgi:hypothetical protein